MEVTFKFKPNQRVNTPFGDIGIIGVCGVDDNEILTYFVRRSDAGQ